METFWKVIKVIFKVGFYIVAAPFIIIGKLFGGSKSTSRQVNVERQQREIKKLRKNLKKIEKQRKEDEYFYQAMWY